MAIFHLTTKAFSRGRVGRTVVAAAAYRARERLSDERTGRTFDYRRRRAELAHAEVLLPTGAPPALRERESLWNGVEAREQRADARLAREFEISLPRELSAVERLHLIRGWALRELVGPLSVAVDLCVHVSRAADGGEQPHAHLLVTDRALGPTGFGSAKIRVWNTRKALREWRESWEEACNAALASAGHSARVSHCSYAARKLAYIATPKLGPVASLLEAKGVLTARGELARLSRLHNASVRKAAVELAAAVADEAESRAALFKAEERPFAGVVGPEAAAKAVAPSRCHREGVARQLLRSSIENGPDEPRPRKAWRGRTAPPTPVWQVEAAPPRYVAPPPRRELLGDKNRAEGQDKTQEAAPEIESVEISCEPDPGFSPGYGRCR